MRVQALAFYCGAAGKSPASHLMPQGPRRHKHEHKTFLPGHHCWRMPFGAMMRLVGAKEIDRRLLPVSQISSFIMYLRSDEETIKKKSYSCVVSRRRSPKWYISPLNSSSNRVFMISYAHNFSPVARRRTSHAPSPSAREGYAAMRSSIWYGWIQGFIIKPKGMLTLHFYFSWAHVYLHTVMQTDECVLIKW